MDADVIVVGAGPAGSVAALTLARAGVRVRLLDRDEFPRGKLCGDTLNPGTVAILRRLGVGDDVVAGALPVTGMLLTGPGGASVASDYPRGLGGLAMTRRVLDDRLVGAACAAGALFEPSTAVRAPLVDGADRISGVRIAARVATPLRSRVVIAADGRASKLGRMLGLSAPAQSPRRWAFGAYFENVSAMSTRGEMHVRCGAYIGIAPVPSGLSNVCLVRDVNRLRQAARYGAGDVIEQSVKTDHALRGRFAHAKRVSPVVVLGPLAVRGLAAGCPGLLLAGDAAGFVDPMTGDGLRFAIRGGELAAHAALRELDSGMPAYLELARERRREFARKWQVNRLLRGLVASPFSLRVAAAVARQWDAPFSWLVDFAGDVPLARAAATAGAPVP